MAAQLQTDMLDHAGVRSAIAAPADAQAQLLDRMRAALADGRAELRTYFESGGNAEVVHVELARLIDSLVQGALDYADRRLYGTTNPTTGASGGESQLPLFSRRMSSLGSTSVPSS